MLSRVRRINAFVNLGKFITSPENKEIVQDWVAYAKSRNNWFTPENVTSSLKAIASEFLEEEDLQKWAAHYPEPAQPKKVGVVMAGNIPAVGFHDALSVLVSGHILLVKPSSDDTILITALLNQLVEIEPGFKDSIEFVDRLNDSDAYIATGSDNTARYFHYYFAKKPNIIRKNRTSVAILTGAEISGELENLGKDVLQYFGLGCRNVSKVFVPTGYDFTKFYESIQHMDSFFLHNHKYFNNYEYNKSIFLINRVPHVDNGFLMITENPALVSPISVLHFETYDDLNEVKSALAEVKEKVQCVIGQADIEDALPFGKSQEPGLFDYADGVDTMTFLSQL
ncbi:acyl-CoA reductase [Dyadobacter aurulentus]|uniref:acyl-CoA reductase n=1 Tax=Dyadobacter sp. UC 10 TaxID=2605428 RepID=UPI0011F3B75C|nr:acyl-CoA reductase [Dyadobacter sp. UC 10]KAA0993609.1 acyl-CoA reductase [Dyadobacter sp. UC 10]